MKNVKKIGAVFLKVLSIIIIACLLIALIRSLIFKKDDVFGYNAYIVVTGSMEPKININDLVVVRETDNLQKGDIIAFKNGASVTVHRIVNIKNDRGEILYQTKGDNNNVEDSNWVKKSEIKGRVVGCSPGIGHVAMFLRKNILWVTLALVIIIVIILVRKFI